jgi:hypothetical protein
MGCDIHWYSETKQYRTPEKTDFEWICDQATSLRHEDMDEFAGSNRDYWFFGLLFNGVRTDWSFAFSGKHLLPEGVSPPIKKVYESWAGDAHSHSWLTRKELEEKLAELHPLQAEMLINPRPDERPEHVQYMIARLKETIDSMLAASPDADSEDHRLVFWFDN